MLHLVALMAPIKPDVNICHISGCRLRLESQFLPDKSVGRSLHLQGNKSLCVSHISCVSLCVSHLMCVSVCLTYHVCLTVSHLMCVSVCLTSHVCLWRVSISMWLLDSILIIILLDSPLSLSYLLISKELIKRKLNISPSRPLRRVSRAWAARPPWQCGDLRGSWRGGRCSGAVQGRLYTSCVRPLPCPGYRHSSGSSRSIIQSTEYR